MKPIFKLSLATLLLVVNAFLVFRLNFDQSHKLEQDLAALSKVGSDFREISGFFSSRAKSRGAIYAFELLKRATLPANTDLHLLGHVVGDVLYRQEGAAGISVCTDDFRNACSHSIVVGMLLDHGEAALADISVACKKAPGGKGAYPMCFHGLGHGVLAYTDYDLAKADSLCQTTGTKQHQNIEASECVGGAIMEMISGGAHNQTSWQRQRSVFLNSKDPLSACVNDYLPIENRYHCMLYLTPFLIEASGGELSNPSVKDLSQAFSWCQTSKLSPELREVCFGGFGKEFVVLAKSRDIRDLNNVTDSQLKQIYDWCLLAESSDGISACIRHTVNSLYWGGVNDITVSQRFCSLMSEPYSQGCFTHLQGAEDFYE